MNLATTFFWADPEENPDLTEPTVFRRIFPEVSGLFVELNRGPWHDHVIPVDPHRPFAGLFKEGSTQHVVYDLIRRHPEGTSFTGDEARALLPASINPKMVSVALSDLVMRKLLLAFGSRRCRRYRVPTADEVAADKTLIWPPWPPAGVSRPPETEEAEA
jgi:hypothetical protein